MLRMFGLVAVLCSFFSSATLAESPESQRSFRLEQPGVLIITAGQDTSGAFSWKAGPGPGRLSLVWDDGLLSLPDTLALEGYDNGNLGIPLAIGFGGSGKDGPLILRDGVYPVGQSLVMTDGQVQLMVSSGELEIHGNRFRFTRAEKLGSRTKSNYLFIAGMLVLIAVLMRRARMKTRKKT